MANVFVTGSSDGLGLMAGKLLIEQGHEVVLHGRNDGRSRDARGVVPGAKSVVTGDLSIIAGTTAVAEEVNKLGRFDAVIHNAGIGYREPRRVETDAGNPQRLCRQRAGALHFDGADHQTGSAGLSKLRHAPERAPAHGRSPLDQTSLEWLLSLRGKQALRRAARICRRSTLEKCPIQCT